jgi:hypothetical protein
MYWFDIASLFKKLCKIFLQLIRCFSYVTPLSSLNQDCVTLYDLKYKIWKLLHFTSPEQFKMFIITQVCNHVKMSIQLNIKKSGLK